MTTCHAHSSLTLFLHSLSSILPFLWEGRGHVALQNTLAHQAFTILCMSSPTEARQDGSVKRTEHTQRQQSQDSSWPSWWVLTWKPSLTSVTIVRDDFLSPAWYLVGGWISGNKNCPSYLTMLVFLCSGNHPWIPQSFPQLFHKNSWPLFGWGSLSLPISFWLKSFKSK